ncbi:MAG: PsbP-related protein [Patescibacteria group bacterium]
MFGFLKNKTAPTPASEDDKINAQTIPDIFYGGNDPEIYKTANGGEGQSKKNYDNGFGRNDGASRHGLDSRTKKISLIVLGGLLFAGSIGAISWYYLRDYRRVSPVVAVPPTPSKIVATTTEKEIMIESESPAIASASSTTAIETPISPPTPTSTAALDRLSDFPPEILIDSPDFDSDSVTDSEEEVFGTDMSLWDTDSDGYYDGQEIYNLYNPKGFAPVKLIDSGLVREYVSPIWKYRLYYPAKWQVGAVDNEGRQVLFSDATGDYIEVRIINKKPEEDFATWFGAHVKGQRFDGLLQLQNRFETDVWKRNDDLTAYIPGANWTAVLIFHPLTNSPIKSRHIMQTAVQSFRVGATAVQIPLQPVLPVVSAGSTTSAATTTN